MLKIEDLRQLNQDELKEKVYDLRKKFFDLRLSSKTGKLEKNHQIKEVRKDIARILTIQNELRKSPEAVKASIRKAKEQKEQKVEKKKIEKAAEPRKMEKSPAEKEKKPKRGLFGRRKKG